MELFIKFTVNEMVRACNSGKLEELATIIKVPTEELIESAGANKPQPQKVTPDEKAKPIEKQPDPDPNQVAESDAAESNPDENPNTETEEIPTIVDLRAKAQEKGKTAKGKTAIKALLTEFDCKSISNVPEEVRAAFMRKLEEL